MALRLIIEDQWRGVTDPHRWVVRMGRIASISSAALWLSVCPPCAGSDSPIHINGADVLRLEIRTNVMGDFYIPATKECVPGIILLGGSDGEPMKERSTLLASHGYAVLNLLYYGFGSLPKQFAKVP